MWNITLLDHTTAATAACIVTNTHCFHNLASHQLEMPGDRAITEQQNLMSKQYTSYQTGLTSHKPSCQQHTFQGGAKH
jgi:hypothetical protein